MGDSQTHWTESSKEPTFLGSFVRAALRHRAFAIAVLVALTALALLGLTRLTLSPDPLTPMYPEGHPFRPALEAIQKMAPEPAMLVAILERRGGDIYRPETIAKVDRITKKLMSTEWVLPTGVTSLTKGFTHYEYRAEGMEMEPVLGRSWPKTDRDFELLRRKVAVNPMGPGAYVSYDGTATMITAPLSDVRQEAEEDYRRLPDAEKTKVDRAAFVGRRTDAFFAGLRQLVKETRVEEEDTDHRLLFMGPQLIEAEMTAMGLAQLPVAATETLFVILLLLTFHFRSLPGVLVPVLSMALSVLWGMGIFSLAGRQFNPMALLFPLVLGLCTLVLSGLAVGRVQSLHLQGGDRNDTIAAAYGSPPLFASLTAAALAILVLCVTGVPMLRDLGLLGCFWFAGAFVALFVMSPILHAVLPLPSARTEPAGPSRQGKAGETDRRAERGRVPAPGSTLSGRAGGLLSGLATGPGRVGVLVLLATLLALGGWSAFRLPVGGNIPGVSYLSPKHPWNQCFDLLGRKFMGPFQFLVHARAKEPGGLLDSDLLATFGDFCDFAKTRGRARECISLDMMVEMAHRTLMDGNPKWQTVPASREQIARLAGMVLEQGGVESFVDNTFTQATLSPFFPPPADANQVDADAALVQAYIDTHPTAGLTLQAGGGLLGMTKAVNDATRRAFPLPFFLAFAVLLIVGWLYSRSLVSGLAAFLAAAAAQAAAWGLMSVAGTPVSMPLIPGALAATGLAGSFSFPLLRRRSRGRKDSLWPQGFSVNSLQAEAGEVFFLGGLFLCACLPWFFIGLRFQSQMVLAAGLTALLEAVACIIFVPALLGSSRPLSDQHPRRGVPDTRAAL